MGATLDIVAVKRDAILAGGFAGMNGLAGTLDWMWLPMAALFGAGLGSILHLMPAEPRPDDSRRGRIAIRAVSGFLGGAWAGVGFAYIASGYAAGLADAPTPGALVPNLIVGALTGALWYIVWGIWETRKLTRR